VAQSQTARSTRKLSEVTRHLVMPSGIVTSGWAPVEEQLAEFGVDFDEWQRGAGQLILGKRENGEYAATIGGVTLSIPRQVAKTFMVAWIVFALCTLFPGLTVLWSAHRTRTASKTFASMRGYATRKSVAPHVANIRSTNGEQEIQFTNGSIIMFGAREQGFGRGFDEVDIEVFDEAQILTEKALEDMVAATNQSRFPAGALLFFMGTPPRPVDPGEAFKLRRKEALEVEAATKRGEEPESDAVYIECSADPNADPDDRKQWAKANPSYPHRTPLRSMLRLRKNLPGDDSWKREALGIWDPDYAESSVISATMWSKLIDKNPPTEGEVTYGIRFSPDGLTVAISAALRNDDSPVHIELIDTRSMVTGLADLIDWIVARESRATSFVIDGKAHRDALVNALLARGFKMKKILLLGTDPAIAAHSMMLDAVKAKAITHFNDEQLNESVAHAGKRKIGNAGGWGWQALQGGDVTPFESATIAHYGALIGATKKQRTGASVFR
jgi:hypothetical protein